MSLLDYKITSQDIAEKGVIAAPDKLTGNAQQNKAVFDRLIREAVSGLFNGLIDALEQYGVEKAVQYVTSDNEVRYVRLNSDLVLETSADGVDWQATGSSGHIIVDKDGNQMAQRSRLRFIGDTNVYDGGTETVVSGLRGLQGEKGDTGDQGPQGEQGEKGDKGAAWYPALDSLGNLTFTLEDTETPPPSYNIRGPQGPQGVQGVQGATGATGSQGIQGPQGVQGPQGEQGATGPTGAQGAAGPQGATGAQGERGPAGADGRDFKVLGIYATLAALQLAHPTGTAGDAYAVGSSASNTIYIWDVDAEEWTDIGALQGPMGPQGPAGAQGPTGPAGATGPQGPQGIQGIQGEQGPQGVQGQTGAQGPQGVAGQSAYTAAQSAGYTGTETQFNSDLTSVGSKIDVSTKGVAGGVASLDSSGKVPSAQLPAMNYIPTSQKGAANGVASLGSDGKVPTAQLPAMSSSSVFSKTLTAAGWVLGSDGRYYQSVSVTGVTATTKIILADVDLTTSDADARIAYLEAWAGPSANEVTQGSGTLTFYSYELPTVNIPVFVGVVN